MAAAYIKRSLLPFVTGISPCYSTFSPYCIGTFGEPRLSHCFLGLIGRTTEVTGPRFNVDERSERAAQFGSGAPFGSVA